MEWSHAVHQGGAGGVPARVRDARGVCARGRGAARGGRGAARALGAGPPGPGGCLFWHGLPGRCRGCWDWWPGCPGAAEEGVLQSQGGSSCRLQRMTGTVLGVEPGVDAAQPGSVSSLHRKGCMANRLSVPVHCGWPALHCGACQCPRCTAACLANFHNSRFALNRRSCR